MVVGIGTDMIEIARVIKACEKENFIKRYFTEAERELILQDRRKSAGNFAVKEAVVKLFGTGFGKVEPIEIETLRDALGKPYVNLYKNAKEMAQMLQIEKIHVTITNTKKYASAFVVGETCKE